ncbi:hypothetical protein CEXT_383501 [Caerostris extrusa]|uniref:Uncharacterized protein n=1 Tax=Caerostris extrusa TaxID=172846 RepID=A0AAV4XJE2_CAEEX|nr:hypothetical protein CEXT_383501 [Caerostris extrusa]
MIAALTSPTMLISGIDDSGMWKVKLPVQEYRRHILYDLDPQILHGCPSILYPHFHGFRKTGKTRTETLSSIEITANCMA